MRIENRKDWIPFCFPSIWKERRVAVAESYYRTIRGRTYDRELLEIVEKATKRTKSPLSKSVARSLFQALSDGGKYTDIEKRTIQYIRSHFSFAKEADEFLRTEVRKWAAENSKSGKKRYPSSKEEKPKRTRNNKKESPENSFFYEMGDEISPTPEYNEMIALNRFGLTKDKTKRSKTIIMILFGLLLVGLIFLVFRGCKRDQSLSSIRNQGESSQQKDAESNLSPLKTGKILYRFETRAKAIRFINDLQIRFIKQSLSLEIGASDKITTLAEALKSYPSMKIRVKGHTCFIGEMDENKILSEKRAKLVYDELLNQGVSSSQLDYRGFGETAEISSNQTESGRVLNRRVDFSVLSVQEK